MTDWKQDHASDAERFAQHEMIDEVLSEFALNMGFERKGLPEYGLQKIVMYTAQVVLARARRIEPEALRMTDAEYNASQIRRAHMFADAGTPVVITDGHTVIGIDPMMDRPEQPA